MPIRTTPPELAQPNTGGALRDLAQMRSGDSQALDRLIRTLQDRFRTDSERRVGPTLRRYTRASDVLQDAYLEVVRSIGKFEGTSEGEFYRWVTTIIEHTARRQHRRLTAQKRTPPRDRQGRNERNLAYVRAEPSPLAQLTRQEDLDQVHRAVRELRQEHRDAIELVLLAEMPIVDFARQRGRTEAAARMLVSRARAALSAKLTRLRCLRN